MDTDPTITLPPGTEHWIAYAALALGVLSVLGATLRWAVPQLRLIAQRTESPFDDQLVNVLASALRVIATIVDALQLVLPRITMGRAAEKHPDETGAPARRDQQAHVLQRILGDAAATSYEPYVAATPVEIAVHQAESVGFERMRARALAACAYQKASLPSDPLRSSGYRDAIMGIEGRLMSLAPRDPSPLFAGDPIEAPLEGEVEEDKTPTPVAR